MATAPQEESKTPEPESETEQAVDTPVTTTTTTTGKKKKSKKKSKGKKAATTTEEGGGLPEDVINDVLQHNPALASEFQGMDKSRIEEMMKRMKVEDVMTGMAAGGKNKKDMASYKFWATQPVARFDEEEALLPDGPVRQKNPEVVSAEGPALLDGFEWVTMDLTDEHQMNEVYNLLTGHYVEDREAMFRFNYSASLLNWALKAPGWLKEWHVGVRVSTSKKLVAFISGIPVNLKVRDNVIKVSEINFLCVHKKLRSKRLAPVLIKEITRRCNVEKIWNAIYTAGIVLPKPISTCRYYHRSLDWLKCNEVGFSPLPPNSTKSRQITKYHLPNQTKTRGLREMQAKDIEHVHDLLTRYLARFDMAPQFNTEEIDHWLLHKDQPGKERVIWAYVVEDPQTKKITDMFSFYALESSVIGNKKHDVIRAAYLFYYASEVAFTGTRNDLKVRLNELINDALILAKRFNFDVFNGLTLMDNTLFLQEQKFGAGDGQLHYYLFNWRTKYIKGGVDENNVIDEKNGSGIGMVML
ncbi:glycylpeptide N-tetradecanoyltransferase [Wilcoxina mikolae CBS 423.85]|nr:glycylpeptide N-tetradecanoyltransferase [Wilcoxina mikolae CBS 423.85]